eukprot:s329_g21.t1
MVNIGHPFSAAVKKLSGANRPLAMKRPAAAETSPSPQVRKRPASASRHVQIYVCRHGTTTWNLAKKWQGQQDTELAPEGIQQAEETGKLLASRISRCSRIYASDLKRAHHTAQIYGKALNCEVVLEPRLREPSLGKFEGMHRSDIYAEFADLFKELAKMSQSERLHKAYFEGLESPAETSVRVEALAQDVLNNATTEEEVTTVLFVTHSKVLEAVLAKVFGKFYEGVHTSPGAFFVWTLSDENELGDLHKECAQLLKEAAEVAPFDEVRRLDGEAGQGGAYHFCSGSASPLDHLVKAWPDLCSYGKSLADLEQRCCAAGQKRCATIFLAFGEAESFVEDPYGKLFFPYQAMLMLSRRGTDFTGGEFFVKNTKTGEVSEVPADEGDVTIFAANNAAVQGQDFKHGVRTVRGQRFSVGIARQHHENLLLAAMAFAWAMCQVKYHQVPVCRALAELLACQSERWDCLVARQREKRRRILQESYALLQEVLDFNDQIELGQFSEEVYARVLGEFDLVNVSIEFDHPFQASLDELESLRLAMHDAGLMRRLVEGDWRAAVAELVAEATYQLQRHNSHRPWDFAVVHVSGHDDVSVADVTTTLDRSLGTDGACVGAAVNGCSGPGTDHQRRSVALVVRRAACNTAKPFFVGQAELQRISGLVCQLQGRTRVQGAQESALPRAWRQFLGVADNDDRPNGILLFIDPLASKYVVGSVLSALDLAFPNAVKCGGVCADLLPSRKRLAVAAREQTNDADPLAAGVAGILLPPDMSIHSMVSMGSCRVGPELRVTSADGQIIKQMQFDDDKEAHPAVEMLQEVSKQATPLQQLLIERSGFLLGLEAPKPLDPEKSKVYDDVWGSSERAPSYTALRRQANSCDWLLRSLEQLPGGSIVIRRDNLKRVPPRVGPAWLRCQLHVFNERKGKQELELMLQRYMGARMTIPVPVGAPFGAVVFTCHSWCANNDGEDVGVAEVSGAFDPPVPVVTVNVCGEVAQPGIALGGVDQKRTTVQGHTATCCGQLSPRGNMNQQLVNVGPDGRVQVDQHALKRAQAEGKVKCARYLRFAFFAHVAVLILVNIVVWLIYAMLRSRDRGGTYKWPLWVTFGSIVLVIAHLLSMLPYAVCKGSSTCPRWVWVVLLNLALVNIVVWSVYAASESEACPPGQNCEYLWPAWVSGSTALVAIVVALMPCICGALFGIHDDVGDSELENALYESESE